MIVVLNVSHKDSELALRNMRWMAELGGCKKHEIILQSSVIAAANGLVNELEPAAKEVFGTTSLRIADLQDERGWPWSPNAAWLDAVQFIRTKVQKPWLWMEPDAIPIKEGWLDMIEEEYLRIPSDRYFMGGEVKVPSHRMSGVGVYPAWVAQFTRGFPMLLHAKAGPWDQVLARDFMRYTQFTPLIQNVWNVVPGDPATIPTFPDVESLKLIAPQTVIFHRNKDGTLIERIRESRANVALEKDESEKPDPELRVRELERELAKAREVKSHKSATSKKRTPEEQAKIDARMAKARAARKIARK